MSNYSQSKSVSADNTSVTKTVTTFHVNTHCIVCGSAFQTARMGKKYCSTRCKQFGYNHKVEIEGSLTSKQRVINAEAYSFFIDDYSGFIRNQKTIKRYSQLMQKKLRWERAEHELIVAQKFESKASSFSWTTFLSESLTQSEEDELFTAESELDEKILKLKSRELSIEQWSFIKILYPDLNDNSFAETVTGLSADFLDQLTLKDSEKINPHSIIKNKFINHCNMIALGKIRFEEKKD